jgi:tRNA(His) guanylyltransferase
MKDDLGKRMKENYEFRTRTFLPRRTYVILRCDGKAFHSYTKGLNKPFDYNLIDDFDNAIIATLPHIQGAKFAYVQSDEVSILLTDFETETTQAWFDGNIQKIVSVSSSILTAEFNRLRLIRYQNKNGMIEDEDDSMSKTVFKPEFKLAYFDGRVFTIPDRTEVMNYFIWRNQDCARNSVSMVAQSLYSHHELDGKNTQEKQEMIFAKSNKNWANYPESDKNGRLIIKENNIVQIVLPKSQKQSFEDEKIGVASSPHTLYASKSRWVSKPAWKFTQDNNKLLELIPNYE